MEWKDRTSYSKNDNERVPRILELEIGKLRIKIHRIIHCEGWYLSVFDLNIRGVSLNAEDLSTAKTKGLRVLIEKINELEKIKDIIIKEIS